MATDFNLKKSLQMFLRSLCCLDIFPFLPLNFSDYYQSFNKHVSGGHFDALVSN